MKVKLTIVAAVAVLAAAGWQAARATSQGSSPATAPAAEWVIVPLGSMLVGKSCAIPLGNVLESKCNDPEGDCRLLAGRNLDDGQGSVMYTHSSPAFFVVSGWAYAKVTPSSTGGWGRARTRRVTGTALGSVTVLVQDCHDVYRIIAVDGPGKVEVALDGAQPIAGTELVAGEYYEVSPGQSDLGPKKLVTGSSDVQKLVDHVQSCAN
jgi:hypothetical protein